MLLLPWFLHFLPATTTTSVWSVLEDQDEREEVDELSHAERPLAPFLCQSCGQLPRLLDRNCPLGGALRHTSTRCAVTPAAAVVVATPTIFAATPTVAVPAVATVAASLFPPVKFRQLFLRGLETGSGASTWAIRKALTIARAGVAQVCP